jgi:hypothetical protein
VKRHRARIALAVQLAERLDGDPRRPAMAGTVFPIMIAQHPEWNSVALECQMRSVIDDTRRKYVGLTLQTAKETVQGSGLIGPQDRRRQRAEADQRGKNLLTNGR